MCPLAAWSLARSRAFVATCLSLAVAALVAMGEIARLVEDRLDADGRVGSLGAVLGPKAAGAGENWDTWARLPGHGTGQVASWITWHALIDGVCFLAYSVVLLHLVGSHLVARRFALLVLAAELLELVLLVAAAAHLRGHHGAGPLTGLLALVTTVKWLAAAGVLVTCLRVPALREPGRAWAVRFGRALKYQRLSVVPVVLLGVLSTLPGANILDQLPDAERGWLDDRGGAGHGVAAALALLIGAALAFVIGRLRARRAYLSLALSTPPTAPVTLAARGVWLIGPAVVGAGALLLHLRDLPNTISGPLVAAFMAVPVALVVLSLIPVAWQEPPAADAARAELVRRTGDGLAISLLVILGLGLVRSFTAPAFTTGAGGEVSLLLVGAAVVGGAWYGGLWVVHHVPAPTTMAPPMLAAFGLLGVVDLLCPMLWPRQLAGTLGVVALLLLSLGGWIVLLGALQVYLQDRVALSPFRALHLRAAPVLTLFGIVPLIATVVPGQGSLHYVRTGGAPHVVQRDTLPALFARWVQAGMQAGKDCPAATTPDGTRVRPLLLVAASGGGIRALYWTASFMGELGTPCRGGMTLLSSGVSGGSVGLAVARAEGVPGAVAAARRMSAPDALGAGLEGTLAGDLLAGFTGLRVAERGAPAWRDRAGLMEEQWEHDAPGLRAPWDGTVQGPGGALVLNSTAVGYGCRVLVSQVDLDLRPAAARGSQPLGCRSGAAQLATAVDLAEVYGSCLPSMSWATAAMLSARFPTVTPAGRIPPCDADPVPGQSEPQPDLQLVDGGYAESSGVGTLADLAPDVLDLVRDHNDQVAEGRLADALVVPLVAYLEDEVRSDVARSAPASAAEALVPLAGRKAAKEQTTSAAQLQKVARTFADPCPAGPGESACAAAVDAVHALLPDGVVLVAPSTLPGVNAPLGWTLSLASQHRLTAALAEQRGCHVGPSGYAQLGALLAFADGRLTC